jgi:hypothetical protein
MRCSKCVLPDSFPNIVYDQKGICNYCLNYKRFKPIGEQKLIELLKSFKNKGKRYDCIVPISGGKDSAYTLYYVNNIIKLRTINARATYKIELT